MQQSLAIAVKCYRHPEYKLELRNDTRAEFHLGNLAAARGINCNLFRLTSFHLIARDRGYGRGIDQHQTTNDGKIPGTDSCKLLGTNPSEIIQGGTLFTCLQGQIIVCVYLKRNITTTLFKIL